VTLRVAWLIYGTLEQPTGGYVYDRLIVGQLRSLGALVEVRPLIRNDPVSLASTLKRLLEGDTNVLVGDALCVNELGSLFEALAGCVRRVLLVHHLTSWERESNESFRAALRAQEMRAVRSADLVVTTSLTTAGHLRAEYPDCEPHTVLPGADRLRCLPRTLNRTQLRLLGVGGLIPRKRWELLLGTMDELAEPDLFLRLVGDETRASEYSRSVVARIASSPYLAAHVKYLGVIEDEALEVELAAADALILPSSMEGYGMVLTEALHAGVPVIAAQTETTQEVLTESAAALLFDDESKLLVQLNHFVREPPLRNALRRAAAECAVRLPTWASAGAQFRELLTQPI
jgi:glycosyltransferase involved in cell wall biosynthesis